MYIDRVATWIVVLVVLAGTLVYAVEPLVLYDDFNAGQLAQDKWVRGEEGAGTEPSVQIQDNRLRLFNRIYGKTDSDHGKDEGSLFLAFSNSAAVTTIKATVQVNDVRVYGCPSNPLRSEAVAFLGGSFFNTATPTPGSDVHDVWAAIGLVRNSDMRFSPDILIAISLVGHCTTATNETCKDSTWLHSRGLGPVKRGEKVTFRVQWDRDNHRFIFQRDGDLEVFAPYTLSDTAPPGRPRKGLRIGYEATNCLATLRPVAFIEAVFDDVLVNAAAARASGQ